MSKRKQQIALRFALKNDRENIVNAKVIYIYLHEQIFVSFENITFEIHFKFLCINATLECNDLVPGFNDLFLGFND